MLAYLLLSLASFAAFAANRFCSITNACLIFLPSGILTDVEAVKRSVRNLINTNHFERPFHPEIGGNVRALLFENITPLTSLNLQRKVEEVLNNFEPRAKITQILADPDIDRNGYKLTIKFYVIGIQNPITVETFLERLR